VSKDGYVGTTGVQKCALVVLRGQLQGNELLYVTVQKSNCDSEDKPCIFEVDETLDEDGIFSTRGETEDSLKFNRCRENRLQKLNQLLSFLANGREPPYRESLKQEYLKLFLNRSLDGGTLSKEVWRVIGALNEVEFARRKQLNTWLSQIKQGSFLTFRQIINFLEEIFEGVDVKLRNEIAPRLNTLLEESRKLRPKDPEIPTEDVNLSTIIILDRNIAKTEGYWNDLLLYSVTHPERGLEELNRERARLENEIDVLSGMRKKIETLFVGLQAKIPENLQELGKSTPDERQKCVGLFTKSLKQIQENFGILANAYQICFEMDTMEVVLGTLEDPDSLQLLKDDLNNLFSEIEGDYKELIKKIGNSEPKDKTTKQALHILKQVIDRRNEVYNGWAGAARVIWGESVDVYSEIVSAVNEELRKILDERKKFEEKYTNVYMSTSQYDRFIGRGPCEISRMDKNEWIGLIAEQYSNITHIIDKVSPELERKKEEINKILAGEHKRKWAERPIPIEMIPDLCVLMQQVFFKPYSLRIADVIAAEAGFGKCLRFDQDFDIAEEMVMEFSVNVPNGKTHTSKTRQNYNMDLDLYDFCRESLPHTQLVFREQRGDNWVEDYVVGGGSFVASLTTSETKVKGTLTVPYPSSFVLSIISDETVQDIGSQLIKCSKPKILQEFEQAFAALEMGQWIFTNSFIDSKHWAMQLNRLLQTSICFESSDLFNRVQNDKRFPMLNPKASTFIRYMNVIMGIKLAYQNAVVDDKLTDLMRNEVIYITAYIKAFLQTVKDRYTVQTEKSFGGKVSLAIKQIRSEPSTTIQKAVPLIHGINVVLSQQDEEIFKATVASRKEINLEDALRRTSVYPQLKLSGFFDQLITRPHHNG
jgi:hypothetical protein